jgi:hypothetical protein
MDIDLPNMIAEVKAAFDRYEKALMGARAQAYCRIQLHKRSGKATSSPNHGKPR